MGQVIDTVEMRRVVDGNLRSYLEQVTGSYSRLFGRSPTFVKYFSQDLATSGSDINLGGAIEIIGPESPLRYKVVYDFPIYGVSEADVSRAYDELQGVVSANIGGDASVLPGTLEPLENDFFVIEYLETPLLFRVRSVNPDRIEGRTYSKLEYFLDPHHPDDLLRQITGEYAFELANVGTDSLPIVEYSVALLLREMEVVEEHHRVAYWRAFYDRGSGVALLRSGYDRPVHDRGVDLFISRNQLLGGRGYMKSRTITPVDYADRGIYEDDVYPTTIYYAADRAKRPTDTILGMRLAHAWPATPGSPFFAEFGRNGYYETVPDPTSPEQIGHSVLARCLAGDFTDAPAVVALAARCLNLEFKLTDRDSLRSFIDAFNNDELWRHRADSFWLMPIVLMTARRFRDEARKTTN